MMNYIKKTLKSIGICLLLLIFWSIVSEISKKYFGLVISIERYAVFYLLYVYVKETF
jgi:hypothetical protein